MKYANYIQAVIIACLLVYVFFLRECTNKVKCPELKQDTIRITKVDTIIKTVHSPKPEPDIVTDCVFVFQSVDTAEILKECQAVANEYNRLKIYNRHLIVDTIGTIDLQDTVRRNELLGYTYKTKFKAYTTTIYIPTMVDTKKRLSFNVGAEISYNLNNSMSIAPAAVLITKKQHVYSAAYDPFLKQIKVGGYLKVF